MRGVHNLPHRLHAGLLPVIVIGQGDRARAEFLVMEKINKIEQSECENIILISLSFLCGIIEPSIGKENNQKYF